jgi:hypothetical protein
LKRICRPGTDGLATSRNTSRERLAVRASVQYYWDVSTSAARRLIFAAFLVCVLAVLAQLGYERLGTAARNILLGVGFMAVGALAVWSGSFFRKDPESFALPDTNFNRDRVRMFGYLSPIVGPIFVVLGAVWVWAAIAAAGTFR